LSSRAVILRSRAAISASRPPGPTPAAPSCLPAPSSWWFRPLGTEKSRHPALAGAHPGSGSGSRGIDAVILSLNCE